MLDAPIKKLMRRLQNTHAARTSDSLVQACLLALRSVSLCEHTGTFISHLLREASITVSCHRCGSHSLPLVFPWQLMGITSVRGLQCCFSGGTWRSLQLKLIKRILLGTSNCGRASPGWPDFRESKAGLIFVRFYVWRWAVIIRIRRRRPPSRMPFKFRTQKQQYTVLYQGIWIESRRLKHPHLEKKKDNNVK